MFNRCECYFDVQFDLLAVIGFGNGVTSGYVLRLLVSVVLTGLILLLLEESTKYFLTRLGSRAPSPSLEEFPDIDESSLSKFTSFDPELGWERQPNEVRKKDTGHERPDNPDADTVVYSTDEYGSRVCDTSRDVGEFTVTTYGDSFCFCRGVADSETFQYFLSDELGVHVGNYAVGNYGLDQALLRLKRRFNSDPSEYVILALSDKVTMNRIVSSWKHYFEFGNTFAVKPRYELQEDELQFIPSPITTKSDLLTLEQHREFLRTHDYHYENWFVPHQIDRPYVKYWIQNHRNIPFATFSVLEYITRNQSTLAPVHNRVMPLKRRWSKKDKCMNRVEYRRQLRDEFLDLFCELLSEFAVYVRENGAVPIYFPIRDADVYQYEQFEPIGELVKSKIRKECPELNTVDVRDEVANQSGSIDELYVRSNPIGGHPSPTHNQYNADFLARFIREHRGSH